MITASDNARCRKRNCLSSREVKSTGAKSRVVIFPSTVIAKVALTNGRALFLFCRGSSLLPDFLDETLAASPTVLCRATRCLLRLRDFMLRRLNFALHFAQLHALGVAARFVEEVNNAAGQTAHHHDEKTERTNEHGDAFVHAANLMQHRLQNFLAKSNACETDRQRRYGALDWHDRKKIRNRNISAQRERRAKKSREGREMSDQGCGECQRGCDPVVRVEM